MTAPEPSLPPPEVPRSQALRELAAVFLRLGLTAFGGPAAHVAMMDEEIVRRRRWMSREDFLDHYGAANLIPGPTSTELVIHIGHHRGGVPGLIVAGSCFILPAALLTGAIAWAYTRYGALPEAAGLLYGIKPVIIAVIIQALHALARTALKTRLLVVLALAGAVASLLGVNALAVLLGAGAITMQAQRLADRKAPGAGPPAAVIALPWIGGAAAAVPFGLWPLFLFFLKIGAVLFGSGYVLLAFLRADLVERLHWLSEAQLLDAVAVGQLTPGPLFTTATFIGYLLGGAKGAALATLGIFTPAFVYVALSRPLLPRIRRSRLAGAFLDGVNAASLALMSAVAFQLGRAAIIDVPTALLAAVSALILVRYKPSSAWLVMGGALLGLALTRLR